jgi:DNA-binding SARP family transcriptional activator
MTFAVTEATAEAGQELARGLASALDAHYDDAAAHFTRARDLLPADLERLFPPIAAFLESHSRYWQAQLVLHEASRRFAAACAEQQEHLAGLQHLVASSLPAAIGDGSVDARDGRGRDSTIAAGPDLPGLRITCFGRFAVWRTSAPVALCSSRNGQAILRYLAAHPRHRETSDALMETLWPGEPPEQARHKLHCAASALRRALNCDSVARKEAGYLLCEGRTYALNPALSIRIDRDDFVTHYEAGRQAEGAAAIAEYEAACNLHSGPFLPDDLYADWSAAQRERLSQLLVTMCAAVAEYYARTGQHDRAADWAMRILEEDRCDEAAYQLLIRARALGGNRAEAIRQYERCKAVLAAELAVAPLPATTALFYAILRDEMVPAIDSPAVERR